MYSNVVLAVYWTGGSLNPARSFGPNVVLGKFDREHWIYWVGPALGALLAVLLYRLIKILEYETANAAQEVDSEVPEPHTHSGESLNPSACMC
jgi:aquaporin related protein